MAKNYGPVSVDLHETHAQCFTSILFKAVSLLFSGTHTTNMSSQLNHHHPLNYSNTNLIQLHPMHEQFTLNPFLNLTPHITRCMSICTCYFVQISVLLPIHSLPVEHTIPCAQFASDAFSLVWNSDLDDVAVFHTAQLALASSFHLSSIAIVSWCHVRYCRRSQL